MAHIYFTRHGQTFWNVENKICGVTDIELTSLGHEQAKKLGEEILKKGYKIDEILCSPLIRAVETAINISKVTAISMRVENRLIEQNFGKYESTPRNGKDFKQAKGQFVNSYNGGESMMKVAQRIYNLLDELKNDDNVYLLVAHNGISRVIRSYFYDMSNEEYSCYGIKNCEILEYEFK